MISKSLPLLLIALLLPLPALAVKATYKWRDSNGVIHFTDDPDSIPERYLNSVKQVPSAGTAARKVPEGGRAVAASPAVAPADAAAGGKGGQQTTLPQQLESLKNSLAAKKQELARLRHKWALAKGRTPTAEELKEFEEKRKKGTDTPLDNPYVNKSALSVPAPRRAAYYQKLQEIKQDEERLRELEKQIAEQKLVAR